MYKGRQKGRGRKRIRDGKIDVSNLDKRRLRLISSNKERDVFAGMVYCVILKRVVLAVFVYYKDEKTGEYKTNKKNKVKPEIIICTDVEVKAKRVMKYYVLRYQVEFLIRLASGEKELCLA